MRLIFALIIALPAFLTEPVKASQTHAPTYIRVMSFNIRYDEPRDGGNAWPNRKKLVASLIRFHHVDIVGVQEALKGQLDDLSELLPEYAWLGVARGDGKSAGEFSAIFYRRDRFKSLESSTFWLSETPDVPSKGWDAALPRIVTWAKFSDNQTGKVFFHFNTHFDHLGVRSHEESARLLLQRIDQLARRLPVLVTGDFNFIESSKAYQILTVKGLASTDPLRDTKYISEHEHYGPTSTFNDFKALVPNKKIDYVFVKGNVRVMQHGILSETWDLRFPSDHFPVLAEIILE